jgi:superfamily II DNA/RNA helicase
VLVEVARPNAAATNVEQRFYSVAGDDKRAAVKQLLRTRELSQALIFVNSKIGAARLARTFEHDGYRTQALHGDKSQDERLKALAAFKAGEVDLMVATDVAARGLDIADLPAVFNFDVPFHAEDYVHRIGRTGRAGASGLAVTLVARDDMRLVAEIEKLLKRKIEIEPFELDDERWRRPRRRPDDDGADASRGASERAPERSAERGPARSAGREPERSRRPAPAAADPFFDRPYEPTSTDAPTWEKTESTPGAAAAPAKSTLSPNIRTKKKVASLLGGG